LNYKSFNFGLTQLLDRPNLNRIGSDFRLRVFEFKLSQILNYLTLIFSQILNQIESNLDQYFFQKKKSDLNQNRSNEFSCRIHVNGEEVPPSQLNNSEVMCEVIDS
jgi:hypothetical protein